MLKEIYIQTGKTELASGWTVIVNKKNRFTVKPGGTARHEAIHTVAALLTNSQVKEASRIPGPGYLGITKLNEFNPISFMAAHALGCDGTGHDVAVVRYMGHSPESVASSARRLLVDKEEEIHAVSSLIEEKGTITGTEARQAMDEVSNPEADVEMIGPNGEKRNFVAKTRKGKNFFVSIGLPEKPASKKNDPKISEISDYKKDKNQIAA